VYISPVDETLGYGILWLVGALIFQYPVTELSIQGLVTEGLIGPDTICVPLDCPICSRPHLIDPKTGKVRDADKKSNE
jgi:hypothetical protein